MGLRSKICILGLLVVFSSAAAYADEKRSNFSKIDKNSTLGWLKYPTEPSPERRGEKKNEVIRKYQLPPKTKNNVYKAMLPAFYQDLDFDAYYRFTFEDLVWATLAIEGETDCDGREHSAAVLWTIAQRGGINPKRRLSNDKSYADALIEYCQPIKPKWANPKKVCAGKNKDEVVCDPKVIARRKKGIKLGKAILKAGSFDLEAKELQTQLRRHGLTKADFKSFIRPQCLQIAYDFVTGNLPNPVPGATEFAQHCKQGKQHDFLVKFQRKDKVIHSKSRRRCPSKKSKKKGGNLFFTDEVLLGKTRYSTKNWDGSEIKIISPSGSESRVASRIQETDEPKRVAEVIPVSNENRKDRDASMGVN